MGVMDLFRVDGARAVVVGASKGIGRSTCIALAEAGADVVAAARSGDEVAAVASEVTALGRRGLGLTVDARDPQSVLALADRASEFMGGVTIWVNAVGGIIGRSTPDLVAMEPDHFDGIVSLNLNTAWNGCRAAARVMEEGAIVNISSLAGSAGAHVGFGAYGAAKAALNSMTATLSHELAPAIRVNAVAPGSVVTEAFLALAGAGTGQPGNLPGPLDTPLERHGRPIDIAAAILFLASPASGWITGQCLHVTGGRFFRRAARVGGDS
jgi:7-alpha-hydroxysteroid dehydrogenase